MFFFGDIDNELFELGALNMAKWKVTNLSIQFIWNEGTYEQDGDAKLLGYIQQMCVSLISLEK